MIDRMDSKQKMDKWCYELPASIEGGCELYYAQNPNNGNVNLCKTPPSLPPPPANLGGDGGDGGGGGGDGPGGGNFGDGGGGMFFGDGGGNPLI